MRDVIVWGILGWGILVWGILVWGVLVWGILVWNLVMWRTFVVWSGVCVEHHDHLTLLRVYVEHPCVRPRVGHPCVGRHCVGRTCVGLPCVVHHCEGHPCVGHPLCGASQELVWEHPCVEPRDVGHLLVVWSEFVWSIMIT